MNVPDAAVWRRPDGLAVVEGDQRTVILDLSAPERPPFVLTGAGTAIWAAVDGTRSASEIVSTVAAEHGLEDGAVDHDVRAFLADLAARGLVTQHVV
ncbi:hypothetical protein JCM18899A_03020 [Nocardioides sp. AN3]